MFTRNLTRLGYDFIDDLDVNLTIQDIGDRFGGIYRVPGMALIQTLTPRSKAEPPNTYSGLFGYGEFPFHTDLAHWHRPPRYLVMRCVTPDESVSTRLVPATSVLPEHHADAAQRALFKPRRRLDQKSYFLRVSEPSLSRWDSIFIEPANKVAMELKFDIEARLSLFAFESVVFSRAGQVLIIDNWSILHGRSPVSHPSQGRAIERVYLNTVSI